MSGVVYQDFLGNVISPVGSAVPDVVKAALKKKVKPKIADASKVSSSSPTEELSETGEKNDV